MKKVIDVDNIQKYVDSAVESCGCVSEAELARKMEMLPQNFNQKKKRGTIIKAIARFIEKEARKQNSALTNTQGDDYTTLIGQAGKVLQSGTIYGDALRQNIKAFYCAVNNEKNEGKLKESG